MALDKLMPRVLMPKQTLPVALNDYSKLLMYKGYSLMP